MRVIAGSLKGRRLKPPSWEGLRPTSDKLRETLFNILAPRVAGARVADAYAGTGAVGIEALSRGARAVVFIERDRRAQALIAENLAHCGVAASYTIARADALAAFGAERPEAAGTGPGRVDRPVGGSGPFDPFDIIVLDPPYALGDDELARVLAAAGERLAPAGVAVLERARRRAAPDAAGRLARVRDVISGASALTFYEHQPTV